MSEATDSEVGRRRADRPGTAPDRGSPGPPDEARAAAFLAASGSRVVPEEAYPLIERLIGRAVGARATTANRVSGCVTGLAPAGVRTADGQVLAADEIGARGVLDHAGSRRAAVWRGAAGAAGHLGHTRCHRCPGSLTARTAHVIHTPQLARVPTPAAWCTSQAPTPRWTAYARRRPPLGHRISCTAPARARGLDQAAVTDYQVCAPMPGALASRSSAACPAPDRPLTSPSRTAGVTWLPTCSRRSPPSLLPASPAPNSPRTARHRFTGTGYPCSLGGDLRWLTCSACPMSSRLAG